MGWAGRGAVVGVVALAIAGAACAGSSSSSSGAAPTTDAGSAGDDAGGAVVDSGDGGVPLPTGDSGGGGDAGAVRGDLGVVLGTIPKTILWVGAHPDDEGYAAPILFDACNLRGAACAFLVITDGGKGNCKLGAGVCGTADKGGAPAGSVGAFRVQEMQQAATFFHGTLIELALEDTPSATVGGVAQNWNQTYSQVPNDTSIDLIVKKISDAIQAVKPDVVVTFDPRHGTYCHPDHRAAGALTLVAANGIGFDLSRVFLVENADVYLDTRGVPAERPWVPDDPLLRRYDTATAGTWHAIADDYGNHKSQYTAGELAGLDLVPSADRDLALVMVSTMLVGGKVPPNPAYDAICASENTKWDGRGVCPKADGGVGPCL